MAVLIYNKSNDAMELRRDDACDSGIDIATPKLIQIPPGGSAIIDTGIAIEFPLFSRLRRSITKLILGIDIVGIGVTIKPRGRSQHIIGAGVVDPSYRGTIKIYLINPSSDTLIYPPGEYVAQLVPHLCLGLHPYETASELRMTSRGKQGGINVRTK